MAKKKLLLVEGTDDFHVVLNLQGDRGFRVLDTAEIEDCKGDDKLLGSLPTRIKASEDAIIGVLLDADVDIHGRWNAVRSLLTRAGYGEVPENPDPKGTILEPVAGTLLPRIGIWLMPNNLDPGMLEDFLRTLVPADDPHLPIADSTVNGLPDRRFSDNHRSKAIMHTWLAWQKEPGKPFGQAITIRFLESNSANADNFCDWLKRLFS